VDNYHEIIILVDKFKTHLEIHCGKNDIINEKLIDSFSTDSGNQKVFRGTQQVLKLFIIDISNKITYKVSSSSQKKLKIQITN